MNAEKWRLVVMPPARREFDRLPIAVAAAVLEGYLRGLDGVADEGDVRFAFARGTALRLSWLPRGDRPAWDATIAFLQRLASDA